ncbi:hypothetical protein GW17_00056623 [Ensete ventricosum]|nr:hypothetical protein GW17_00056623 [Ensete ventricosum]
MDLMHLFPQRICGVEGEGAQVGTRQSEIPRASTGTVRVWWPGNPTKLQLSGVVVLPRRVDLPESRPQGIPPGGVLAGGPAVKRVHNGWREPRVGQHPPIAVRDRCQRNNLLRLGKGVWSPEMLRISVAWRALL